MYFSFQFALDRDSVQEPFFNENGQNEAEQERNSRLSPAVEEWCECRKGKSMLIENECRCCHEAASHYLNDNIRVGSRKFALSKLKIFATK